MTGSEETVKNENPQTQAMEFKEKGTKAMNEKRYDDAIRHYNKAIELDPNNHIFYSNRSAAYAHQEEYNLSLKDAEKTIELNPTFAKGYSRKGAALVYMDRFKEAKEAYEKGLELDPQNKVMSEELEKCIQRMKDPALSQPLSNPFAMPGVDDKLKSDPRTSQHMDNPDYQDLLEKLKRDPKSLGKRLESPEVMEILSVLLGIDIKIPLDDDDDNEKQVFANAGEQPSDATEKPHAKEPQLPEATRESPADAEEDQPTDVMDKIHTDVTPVQVEDNGRECVDSTDNSDCEENNFDEIDDESDHNESSDVAHPIQAEHESEEDMYGMASSSHSQITSPSLPFHDYTRDTQEETNDEMATAGPNDQMTPAPATSPLCSTVDVQPECHQKQKDITQVSETVTEQDLPVSNIFSSLEKDGSHDAEEVVGETMASSLDSEKHLSEEANEVPTEANHNG